MGVVHSRAIRASLARTVAIATSTPERSSLAAAGLGFERPAGNATELTEDPEIDVVHVCTPNSSHAALATAALAAGKHVVCEKPIATSVSEATELVSAADAAGRIGAVPFVYRYHPMVREARARIARGDIGALLSLDCGYLQDWMLESSDDDWRAGSEDGGPSRAFADIGSHLCDLVEFVTGERIIRLSARTRRVFEQRARRHVVNEDIVALLVELESGAVGTLLISQMAAGRKNAVTLEVHGSRQSVRFDQEHPEQLWIGARTASQLILRDPSVDAPDSARLQSIPAGHPTGYQDAFTAFVSDVYSAIAGHTPNGLPTFRDGLRAVELTESVLTSARSGAWVDTTPGFASTKETS